MCFIRWMNHSSFKTLYYTIKHNVGKAELSWYVFSLHGGLWSNACGVWVWRQNFMHKTFKWSLNVKQTSQRMRTRNVLSSMFAGSIRGYHIITSQLGVYQDCGQDHNITNISFLGLHHEAHRGCLWVSGLAADRGRTGQRSSRASLPPLLSQTFYQELNSASVNAACACL